MTAPNISRPADVPAAHTHDSDYAADTCPICFPSAEPAVTAEAASDDIPVSPPDLHRLVLLALPVTPDDDEFVERMRAASEGGT